MGVSKEALIASLGLLPHVEGVANAARNGRSCRFAAKNAIDAAGPGIRELAPRKNLVQLPTRQQCLLPPRGESRPQGHVWFPESLVEQVALQGRGQGQGGNEA